MKVTINPATGEVSFDVDTVDQALELARSVKVEAEVLEEKRAPSPSAEDPPVQSRAKGVNVTQAEYFPDVAADLNGIYYNTWEFLYRHDGAVRGVTVAAVARGLHLKNGTANQRLCVLVRRGYAKRLTPGRYEWSLP